jgi:acetyltransferase-like isoleucine patch superfamily enzyme
MNHSPSAPSATQRVGPALSRRWRLQMARLRFRHARFGARCDIRRGLHLQMRTGAKVEFGAQCVLDRDMTIECEGALQVGARTIFGHHCTLAAYESVVIGEDCLIAEMVSIRDHDHRFDDLLTPVRDQGASVQRVEIGRNVWLGAKVTVTKGVRIGDNAIVGANAVVTKDVPPNAIAVGIPARVIRLRTDP